MPLLGEPLLHRWAIIETIIDRLKNVYHTERLHYRNPGNFLVNLLCGLIAYCRQLKQPSFSFDTLPTLITEPALTLLTDQEIYGDVLQQLMDNGGALMLSICVVTQQYKKVISGIGLHARNLVSSLSQAGHQVVVITPEDQKVADQKNVSFIGVPIPLLKNNQARWIFLAFSFARALHSLKSKGDFHLVHFTDAREALFCQQIAPLVGNINDTYAAEVQSIHYYLRYYSDGALRWGYYQFTKLFEARALRRLQAVIANSQYTASVISSKYLVPKDKLYVCYKSIDPTLYTSMLSQKQDRCSSMYHILFIGGNMQRKGLPVLIKASSKVLKILPNTKFWVVGSDTGVSRMISLSKELGVHSNFCFLGWIPHEDLVNLYSQTDIFVMPSLTEAFGVTFLEAMACGVPVIGTRVGGIPEIIQHGYNGLLVEPNNSDDLADAIIQLLSDSELRKQLRIAGVETAHRFDVSRMMECTYSIYKRIIGSW